jgi:hypothetical protein
MPGGALENHSVVNRVPVAVGPTGWVLHRGHAGSGEGDSVGAQTTFDLLYYVFYTIAVPDNPAFINVSAHENNFGHYRRVSVGMALVVDSVELRFGEGSNHGEAHPVSLSQLFEIGTNERPRRFGKRNQPANAS